MAKIDKIKEQFYFSNKQLKDMTKIFLMDMKKGLAGKKSPLKMISSYTDICDKNKLGTFMAFDLGGSNFRVMIIKLLGKGKTKEIFSYKKSIPQQCMEQDKDVLFGFMADTVKKAVKKAGIKKNMNIKAGFTFSFPVEQKAIDRGYLIKWTKGFTTKEVKGHNIIDLMNTALKQKGLDNISVNALVNDTVGTQVAESYKDKNTSIGIILGTGSNACYTESTKNINEKNRQGYDREHMIINMEWGNFDKARRNIYDERLDRLTPNPGHQYLEKMVSGMYLGEIYRLVLLDLVTLGDILSENDPKIFQKKYSLSSSQVSDIEKDISRSLTGVSNVLKTLGITQTKILDRKKMKEIAGFISDRAANMVAIGISAVIGKIDPKVKKKHTIAIDGSVYEKYHKFPDKIRKGLKNILKEKAKKIKLVLSKDGSGKGAALISAAVV
ncbi:MAG: hypothetical protein PHQ52_05850 [Candidatus Omnitrophica bacterium]|nr:hypothetical protein [Candidatus Omnitrophota bacterium]